MNIFGASSLESETMIVKMSKIEIAGPKEMLQEVLYLLRDMGIFQIEPVAAAGLHEKVGDAKIRPFSLDERTAFERLFLNDLRDRIDELFSYLPPIPVRTSHIEPRAVIHIVSKTIPMHITTAKDMHDRRKALEEERTGLAGYESFLAAAASLFKVEHEAPDLEFIGITIKDPDFVVHLREAIARITDWKFELLTKPAEDGTLVGLIAVEKEASVGVKQALVSERVPELILPPSFGGLTFQEKLASLKKRISDIDDDIRKIDADREVFCRRWAPLYRRVREWIDDRLSLLQATAFALETRMCFIILGWIPYNQVDALRKRLADAFKEQVVMEEKELREEDLDKVPVMLSNPAYFRPFELFTQLLPLPRYTSYDPTPFIGIFFPVFFGMILGDAGYGLLLITLALSLIKRQHADRLVRDAAKILLISSVYTVFFGILYGEFFGDLPNRLFGMEPICIERRTAVIPMLVFVLSVGTVHVILGFILGEINALKRKAKREVVFRLLNITVILGVAAGAASFAAGAPKLLTTPVIILILFAAPMLFFTGGLLAPLELLKGIGNIISYARIMAIGLTSVLLAFVANRLTGLMGNIFVGIIVAGMLHAVNIILGVFSPTIHSLRLHYVEFFSKFIEPGGRRFEPLKK